VHAVASPGYQLGHWRLGNVDFRLVVLSSLAHSRWAAGLLLKHSRSGTLVETILCAVLLAKVREWLWA